MRLGRAITLSCIALVASAVPAWAQAKGTCANPNALGIARTVEIDTTGGPGFGFEQYKAHDFLLLKEVVLTFDDGPWPGNTRAVLEALAQHCTKAIFFPIGKHALWHPEILKEVAAAGHTVGGHTWSHANLASGKSWPKRVAGKDQTEPASKATEEIEKGFSAIKLAIGGPPAPFFRFPYLQAPKEVMDYLGTRNIATFSHDLDSFDFKKGKPEDVIKSVMGKLEKKGKGIVLMHDFQQHTAKAMPQLLSDLKAQGYKVVHMRPKALLTTIAQWDEAAKAELKGGGGGGDRPTSSVVRTIEEAPAVTAGKPAPTK